MGIVFGGAFEVGHVAKRRAEQAFLIRAVRSPGQTIHAGVLAGEALRERIVIVIPFAGMGLLDGYIHTAHVLSGSLTSQNTMTNTSTAPREQMTGARTAGLVV